MPYKNKEDEKKRNREYYLKNKEKIKEQSKQWRMNNIEHCNEYDKQRRMDNPERRKIYYQEHKKEELVNAKEYHKEHKKEIQVYSKQWHKENPSYQLEYYKKNSKELNEYGKEWRKNNPEKCRQYTKNRNKRTLQLAAIKWMRNFLYRTEQQGFSKTKMNTITEFGYTPEQLIMRIESQFKDGMSWDNRNEWHIDHKKPISKFNNGTSPRIINMLCNLQPI